MFKKKGESAADRGSSQGFNKSGKESKMSKKADSTMSLSQKDKAKNKVRFEKSVTCKFRLIRIVLFEGIPS